MSSSFEEAAAAVLAGEPVIVPTDTVYGLACRPDHEEAVARMYRLKGRDDVQPTAILAASVDAVRTLVPELDDRTAAAARVLLPGPYTLVVANPGRRFAALTGSRPETLGIRVPALDGAAAELLARVQALAATSANLPGRPDPRRLDDVPPQLRAGVAAAVDGGELPGTPSTVVDCTGAEPLVLREGAVPAAEALARLGAALG